VAALNAMLLSLSVLWDSRLENSSAIPYSAPHKTQPLSKRLHKSYHIFVGPQIECVVQMNILKCVPGWGNFLFVTWPAPFTLYFRNRMSFITFKWKSCSLSESYMQLIHWLSAWNYTFPYEMAMAITFRRHIVLPIPFPIPFS